MRKILLIVSLGLLLVTSLGAEQRGVEVTPSGRESIETEPNRTVTAVFLVTNKTSEKRAFVSRLRVPEGWRVIAKDSPFELEAGQTDIRLVSFLVPQVTLAGKYEVHYLAEEKQRASIFDLSTLSVTVLPVTKLEVRLLEAPRYVIAGESYRACFGVTNRSNVKNHVDLEIACEGNLPFDIDAEKLILVPGESRTVTVDVKTDPHAREISGHRLQLTARLSKDESTRARASSLVEITPRITGAEKGLRKIPLSLSLRQVVHKNEEYKFGFQPEISGAGSLDEGGRRQVKFFYRGPDIQDRYIFRQHDQYRFSLWSQNYELHLGDRAYFLSPLTENRWGRGIEAKLNLGSFDLGAYHQKTRWIKPRERKTAGRIGYSIRKKHNIGLNYLHKEGEYGSDEIVSLHGRLRALEETDIELEYAYAKKNEQHNRDSDDAYLLGVYGHRRGISYSLRFIHAGPDYPGFYRDIDFFLAGLAAPLLAGLRLNAHFQQGKNNLDLDTTRYSAPLEKYYQLGLVYRFETGTTLSLEYRNPIRKDRMLQPGFAYQEKSYRLAVGHGFKKLNLHGALELGRSRDEVTGRSSRLERFTASTYYRPSSRQSYSSYIQYCRNVNLAGKKRGHITAKLEASLRVGGSTHLAVILQTYDYQESYAGDRNDLEMRLTHYFSNRSSIAVECQHSRQRDLGGDAFTAFTVVYTVPFGLPLGRRESVGRVVGSIYDEETKAPLRDVILRLNGAAAVTDKRGRFSFPCLEPGTYLLDINTSRVGLNRIPAQKTPIEVTVKERGKTFLKVGITEGAAVSGRVVLYRFRQENNGKLLGDQKRDNNSGYSLSAGADNHTISLGDDQAKVVEAYGLANILVELANGSETRRGVTDNKGYFVFEELRPGRWTLKIYDHNLPEYHYLEKDSYELKLEPGEKEQVLVKVLPQKRRIRIIETDQSLLKENGK